ncbi:hypothetical protein DXG01_000572 [Tephrocybe rancida]|nr:hypothetical protein DXG01_000572 [Tephrocybe rancida]
MSGSLRPPQAQSLLILATDPVGTIQGITAAVNFGTAGFWDRVLRTRGNKSSEGAAKWQGQRDRQVALVLASKRTGISLTRQQRLVIEQPAADYEWTDTRIKDM